jgi:hypothetical protein
VKEVSLVDVTLDFTGSENLRINNEEELVIKAVVEPMTSKIIALVRAYDLTWSNPCKAS